MAGAVTAAIGLTVALWPDLWLKLFTDDPAALEAGRLYFRIVGPTYGFFGLAMALNFAAMGAGDMIWPTVATVSRFVIAAGVGKVTSAPRTRTTPDRIGSRPTIARITSDLPQPTSPAMPVISPARA